MHSEDDFLRAAAESFATGGERALTMSSVSQRVGASNGSIYHRFPERTSMLAALWTRTARAFQRGYRDALGDPPTAAGIADAGVWVTEWCRDHVAEAMVLQAGVHTFSPDEWTASARAELAALDSATAEFVTRVIADVAARTGLPRDEVAFVMLDLPLAAVRRYLLAGNPPPRRTGELVRSLTQALLTKRQHRPSEATSDQGPVGGIPV